jgi:hypothetical protein
MSIRAVAIFDYHEEEPRDTARIATRLAWALPEAMAVRAHWCEVEKPSRVRRKNTVGKLELLADRGWVLTSKPEETPLRYRGPGGLSVWLNRRVGEIHTNCRWRGFLTIDRLRMVHVSFFHRIANVLKAKTLVIMRNDSKAHDLVWGGAPFEDAVVELEKEYGPPQPSVERISGNLGESAHGNIPQGWFLEDVVYPK